LYLLGDCPTRCPDGESMFFCRVLRVLANYIYVLLKKGKKSGEASGFRRCQKRELQKRLFQKISNIWRAFRKIFSNLQQIFFEGSLESESPEIRLDLKNCHAPGRQPFEPGKSWDTNETSPTLLLIPCSSSKAKLGPRLILFEFSIVFA
jgi:hypothetical protein